MSDPTSSKPARPDGGGATGEKKGHSPVVRIIEWVVIAALGVVVGNEAYSKFSYDATLAELEKAIDAAEVSGKSVTVDEFGSMISGMPTQTESKDGIKTEIDYRWRSLFKTYRILINAAPSPEGNQLIVLSFETDAPPEEPQPAAVAGDGNSESPVPMMPGGGSSGGPPGMPGGPGQHSGAGRPELESEGDDQPEDSDDEADEPDNEPAESDEASEETDETNDETVETEEAPAESDEASEETDEASEESDPSAS